MAPRVSTPQDKEGSTTILVDLAERRLARTIVVLTDDQVRSYRLPEGGQLSIGRAPTNDVCINHPSVSRRHAVLHIGTPLTLEDLGGANGTFIRRASKPEDKPGRHGLKIERRAVEVEVGDCITLGEVMIVLHGDAGAAPRRKAPAAARAATPGEGGVVVRDPAVVALYEDAARAAAGSISVLVLGETGVGKEVLARAIHERSPRAGAPFLGLNCAALPETLLEGELFGHEKGAFTGAAQGRVGLFESADGGTIFLDEVGELPLSLQVKLLRVIEQREVMRVGGRTPRRINVRFVCATNRDLEAEVTRGTFRQDLYFRLNGITLTIPPLRERVVEILPLAEVFAERICEELGRSPGPVFSKEAGAALERYRWPGNVRELRNVVERAIVLCTGDTVGLSHLPAAVAAGAAEGSSPAKGEASIDVDAGAGAGRRQTAGTRSTADAQPPAGARQTAEAQPTAGARQTASARAAGQQHGAEGRASDAKAEGELSERDRIVRALEQCAGNQTRAAELLGISRRTLISRLNQYDLPRPLKTRV